METSEQLAHRLSTTHPAININDAALAVHVYRQCLIDLVKGTYCTHDSPCTCEACTTVRAYVTDHAEDLGINLD